jgi:hypothetical protein
MGTPPTLKCTSPVFSTISHDTLSRHEKGPPHYGTQAHAKTDSLTPASDGDSQPIYVAPWPYPWPTQIVAHCPPESTPALAQNLSFSRGR